MTGFSAKSVLAVSFFLTALAASAAISRGNKRQWKPEAKTIKADPCLSFQVTHHPGLQTFREYVCDFVFIAKSPDFSSPGLGNEMSREECHWLTENSVCYKCRLFYFYCTKYNVPYNYKA